jgi:hypothetical protein
VLISRHHICYGGAYTDLKRLCGFRFSVKKTCSLYGTERMIYFLKGIENGIYKNIYIPGNNADLHAFFRLPERG